MKNICIIILLLFGAFNYTQAQVSIDKQVNMNSIFLDDGNPYQLVEFKLIVKNESACRIAFEVTDDVMDANGSGVAPIINNLQGQGSDAAYTGTLVTWQDSLMSGQSDTLIINVAFDLYAMNLPPGSGGFTYKNRSVLDFTYNCCEDILSNSITADDYLCTPGCDGLPCGDPCTFILNNADPNDDYLCTTISCDSILADTIAGNDYLCINVCDSILNDTILANDFLCINPCDSILTDTIPSNDQQCWTYCDFILNDSTTSNDMLCDGTGGGNDEDDEEIIINYNYCFPFAVWIEGGDDITCFSPTSTLTAFSDNNPFSVSYYWTTTGETSQSITVSIPGIYIVEVYDDLGCYATSSIVVFENMLEPVISNTLSTEVTCEIFGTAEVEASGTGPLDYTWDALGTTFNNGAGIQVFGGGEYFVTVTDMNNGCTAIGSVIVLENTQSPIVTVLATNYVLDSTNPTSDITASSSTFSEYEWSTGETTTSITVSAAGVYTVTVTDMNNGCFTIEEVTITDAAVDCTNSNIQVTIVPQGAEEFTCDNGSVMVVAEVIPAGTYTYEWSQMISTTETNTYFSAGTHFVTVTDTDGCTGVGFIDIFEDLEVPIMELFPLGELDCTNDEVIINADILNWEIFTNYDYQWTGSDIISGNGTPSITVGEAGVYEVTLTNLENACSSTESITITSNEIPPTVNISVSNYILDDTNPTAILTATGNPFFGTYTYEWSTGETTEDITVISGGVYTVEITDVNNGCVTVESITITENFTNPPTTCHDFLNVGGDENDNYFHSAKYVSSQNAYYTIGRDSDEIGNRFSSLLKFDIDGNLIWSKEYYYLTYFVETNNGDLIIVGQTVEGGGTDNDIQVTRIDANANTIWTKIIRTTGSVRQAPKIYNTGTDLYTITCWLDPSGGFSDDLFLNQIDGSGNLNWSKKIAIGDDDQMISRNVASNGDMILCGYETGGKIFILRMNAAGNITQQTYFDTPSSNPLLIRGVVETPDNGYALMASNLQITNEYIIKLGAGGNQEWAYSLNIGGMNTGSISTKGQNILVSVRNTNAPFGKTYFLTFNMTGALEQSKQTIEDYALEAKYSDNGIIIDGMQSNPQNGQGGLDGALGVVCSLNDACFLQNANISLNAFTLSIDTDNAIVQNVAVTHPILNTAFSDIPYEFGNPCENCNYQIADLTLDCSTNTNTCVSLESIQTVPSGIIGMDYCMTYDPSVLTPTGNLTLGSVVTNGNSNATYAINATGFPNQVCVSVYYDSSAPPSAEFLGQGEIACIEFEVVSGTTSGTSSDFTVNNLIESYELTIVEECAGDGMMEYELENTLTTHLTYWDDANLPLKSGGIFTNYLPTYVYGLDDDCIQNGTVGIPDTNGNLQWYSNSGEKLYIQRDINNTTDVMTIINGMDNYLLYQVTTLNPLYTPSIYEIMAMDVNQDGNVTAGDITHLSNRIVLNIGEYPQSTSTPTGLNSHDWVFVTDDLVQADNYSPSASYPFADGLGYDRLNVPVAPVCLDTPLDGQCFTDTDMNLQGILLGDTDKSWNLSVTQLRTGNEEVEFGFDVSEMDDCRLRIPIKVKNGDYVKALDFQLEYNTDKMIFAGVEYGDIDADDMDKNDNEIQAGEIYFSSYAKNKDGIVPNGIVFYYLLFDIMENETVTAADLNPRLSLVDGINSMKTVIGAEYSCRMPETDSYTVSPNPFRDGFQIDIDGYGDMGEFTLVLYDAAGKLIGKKTFTESLYYFEARYLPKGVYVYELLGDGQSIGVGRMISME